jgi:hypothetical protein
MGSIGLLALATQKVCLPFIACKVVMNFGCCMLRYIHRVKTRPDKCILEQPYNSLGRKYIHVINIEFAFQSTLQLTGQLFTPFYIGRRGI